MFKDNYNSEKIIKKWAEIFRILMVVFVCFDVLAALIVASINFENTWWISLIILAANIVIVPSMLFASDFVYGFGEIIGNTKRATNGNDSFGDHDDSALPEL